MVGLVARHLAALAWIACFTAAARAEADGPPVETIVLIRHGEKPPAGLGQLDCRGLNRALALPGIIAARFGRPAALFAPDPGGRKPDGSGTYYYIRPLATIEPTAVALGMPVDTGFRFDDVTGLERALVQVNYHRDVVLAAWEHKQIVVLAKQLMAANGGDASKVPAWAQTDFDGIYVVRIAWSTPPSASFRRLQEGLNDLPATCPAPGRR
jgi:hypothetical protein